MGLSYLCAFVFFLTLSLGALFFVIIQHLTRAGWSVTIRRIAELMAMNLFTLAVLALPVLAAVEVIYHHWAHPDPSDHLLAHKAGYLNWPFFWLRIVLCFAIWCWMAWYYFRHSVKQDETGHTEHTEAMQRYAGLHVVLFAITITFAGFDLVMSLTPHWYSTMFSVYMLAGSMLGFFAVIILILRWLQSKGIMGRSVNVEHYHDLGKWLFGFVFFWTYIAYSQYMLIWYGNLPEETAWFAQRGATTADGETTGWSTVSLLLLFGHFVIPFAALLTRKTKRNLAALTVLALWLFVFHFVDVYWQVLPNWQPANDGRWLFHGVTIVTAVLCWIGVGGVWIAGMALFASKNSLVPTHDPRLGEALRFENF